MLGQLRGCDIELLFRVLVAHPNPTVLDGRDEEKGAVNDSVERAVTPNQLCADKAVKRDLAVDRTFVPACLPAAFACICSLILLRR